MKSFNYGQTIHAQPLSEEGRKNFDKIFSRPLEEEKNSTCDDGLTKRFEEVSK